MSWKNLTSLFALSALLAAPAWGDPTIDITQTGLSGGQRTFGVFVTPDPALFSVDTDNDTVNDASSIAIEVGITSTNPKGGSVPTFTGSQTATNDFLDDNGAPLGNPGHNVFQSGAVTEGFQLEANNTDLFAALGSTGDLTNFPNTGLLSGRTLAFEFTIDSDIGVFDVSSWDAVTNAVVGALVAQDGTNFRVDGTFGIAGDFDTDGDVDTGDFGVFASRFDNPPDANNTGNFDLDNDVDTGDFGVFAGNFDRAMPSAGALQASSVPEPATLVSTGLALCLLMGVARYRRQRLQ